MGLNSFSELLLIMKYYTCNGLPTNWSHKLNNKLIESKNEQWILTQDGLYKYVNDILQKFKLWLPSEESPQPDTQSIIKPSNLHWVKFNTPYNIPLRHTILDIKISNYKLHPKSVTTFIVEELNDIVHDYYFESTEAIDNHSLLEDINSFLSLLN